MKELCKVYLTPSKKGHKITNQHMSEPFLTKGHKTLGEALTSPAPTQQIYFVIGFMWHTTSITSIKSITMFHGTGNIM